MARQFLEEGVFLVSTRLLSLLLLPFLLIGLACSDNDDEKSAVAPSFVVQGSDGVGVAFSGPPSRIVSLAPHATEIFCALGAAESLVAVDKFANCPLGSRSKSEVDSYEPSIEAISSYNPDLVYVFYNRNDLADSLRRLDIRVLVLDVPEDLDGVFENIELIGRISGREPAARALVAEMKEKRDSTVNRVAAASTRPRVFHELDNTLFTARNDTVEGALYQLLRAENIAADAASPYAQLSAETVVARDPDVIVLVDGETATSVKARPGWAGVSAVKNDRICELDPDLLSRPGPRIIDGLQTLAECLYPAR
jgi:iron complex transport system substrate-binding protein